MESKGIALFWYFLFLSSLVWEDFVVFEVSRFGSFGFLWALVYR